MFKHFQELCFLSLFLVFPLLSQAQAVVTVTETVFNVPATTSNVAIATGVTSTATTASTTSPLSTLAPLAAATTAVYASSPSFGVDSAAGASGSDSGSWTLPKGALAAIIAVVVVVALFGGELPNFACIPVLPHHRCPRSSQPVLCSAD